MRAYSHKRFAIVIGGAAAGVIALGAQTTAAAPDVVKHDTKMERIIQDGGGNLHGSLKSEVKRCESGRRVVLFKQLPGADRRLGPARISHHIGAHHDSTGAIWNAWVAPRARGWDVYAEVRRKVVRHRLVCVPDRSPTYRVH